MFTNLAGAPILFIKFQINSNSNGSQSIVEYGQFVKDWFLEKGSDATGTSKIK
jgi:hypothetical protein